MIALEKTPQKKQLFPIDNLSNPLYWTIQSNKTLLHKQKGTLLFCMSFPSPLFRWPHVITPLWHLNFIEQDFKIF